MPKGEEVVVEEVEEEIVEEPFEVDTDELKKSLKTMLLEMFDGWTYSSAQAPKLAEDCSKHLQEHIHDFFEGLYKVCVQVVIVQKVGQGLRMGTRFLWNKETDAFVSESFVADAYAVTALVYYVAKE